jgi:NO-binding membrane sensor protein with MHYT domain/two-component sensor histidine kinase
LVGTYNYWLVLLSVVVAITASYVALDLTSRVAASDGHRAGPYWLTGGAATMGSGIWSMHFIGMLAFRMPNPMSYDVPITALSLLIAAAGSGFALYVTSRRTLIPYRLLTGGALLGLAIAAMHYTGMAAMRMRPPIHYEPGLVTLSVLIAVGTSISALWSAFILRRETIFTAFWRKAGSATVMGAGICGMHYTGMAAALFASDSVSTATAHHNISNDGLAIMLGGCTLIFLMAMLLVSALDAFFAQHSEEHVQSLQALNAELEMHTAELSRVNALLNQEVQVRTKAQDALRAARDELETRVTERTAELVRSNQSLLEQVFERKVAEQALRVSEQHLRRLFGERERLVRDLHDNTVQAIYAAGLRLELIEQLTQEDPTRAPSQVAAAIEYLNGAIRDIRRYIDRPVARINAPPLRDELATLVELTGTQSKPRFRLTVDAGADERLTPDEAEHVLQIAREAMSNSLRHSRAMQGTVTISLTNDGVTLEIKDDGVGFDPTMLKQKSGGLYNMNARAQQIGARLEVLSAPGNCTRIVLHIPKGPRPR